ncbi:MAG: endopeptidase La, partial [Candidatus Latescibacteria bacterium]|nr:endopeptidase La [Candidatus Latescibacterota bacterium]
DHYGLKKPKERILEYLAVVHLTKTIKGPILCFVGPPGVGKTSLGKSIARAVGRKFVRMSLGGVRDEADIRGHRRTYIGALPGRIIQAMRRARTVNPVILLDEIDKMGMDFRGDPAAALLEVLDPEQNNSFHDHYLDIEYDLSRVLFITTANTVFTVPHALRDRMEIISLPGYLEHEKLAIAKGFLVPKQVEANGLASAHVTFTDQAILTIIREYTREAGVRNLEREIAAICRKVARSVTQKAGRPSLRVGAKQVREYLGAPRFQEPAHSMQDAVGVATGLAWTEAGGEPLTIEVSLLRRHGEGKLTLTGQLGEVMQESAHAALSFARARASAMDLDANFYTDLEVHIHVPEGSIPKDGPSAGVAMAAALCSALSNRPVHGNMAMTGEITLRGNVLPVGGLNEKILAARRAGVTHVILPKRNEKDVNELPPQLRKGLTLHLVETMDDVLALVLGPDAACPAPPTTPPNTSGRSAAAARQPARA